MRDRGDGATGATHPVRAARRTLSQKRGTTLSQDPIERLVEKLLAGANAKLAAFERYEVGAGIEKKQGDFAAEVMAQVKGAAGGKH